MHGDFHYKEKTAMRPSYLLMGISLLLRRYLYTEMGSTVRYRENKDNIHQLNISSEFAITTYIYIYIQISYLYTIISKVWSNGIIYVP